MFSHMINLYYECCLSVTHMMPLCLIRWQKLEESMCYHSRKLIFQKTDFTQKWTPSNCSQDISSIFHIGMKAAFKAQVVTHDNMTKVTNNNNSAFLKQWPWGIKLAKTETGASTCLLPRVCKRMLSFSTKSWACCRYSLKLK